MLFSTDKAEKALIYAINSHGDQKREFEGTPYIVHPIRVAQLASKYTTHGNREFVACIGLFHDILEDTKVIEEEMREQWGNRITNCVVGLTKKPLPFRGTKQENFRWQCREEYDRLINTDHFTKLVKIADIFDNTSNLGKNLFSEWAINMLMKKFNVMPALNGINMELHQVTLNNIVSMLDSACGPTWRNDWRVNKDQW